MSLYKKIFVFFFSRSLISRAVKI